MSNITLNLSPALKAHQERDVETCLEEISPILKYVPHHPVALHLKAWAISRKGQSEEALEILANVIAENPKLVPARAEFGSILMANRRHEEALAALKEAHELKPEREDVAVKYGICLIKNHQFKEAEQVLRQTLEHSPKSVQAGFALAISLLQQGQWQEGFSRYRIRHFMDSVQKDILSDKKKEWQGEMLKGKILLIQCEQGYGDQIMFIRYVKWIKDTFNPKKIVVSAKPEMIALLESMPEINDVVSDSAKVKYHRQIPLLNLPHLHQTMPGEVPFGERSYLSVPKGKLHKWAEYIEDCQAAEGTKIGICWRTNFIPDDETATAINEDKAVKSMDCAALEQLCLHLKSLYPDAEFCSLQVGENEDEMQLMERLTMTKSPIAIRDFGDTAAVVDQMDLIVSIDTAVAHLAGALGKSVWNLLPHYADWRWAQDEEFSEWYPDMRLFRQSIENDWSSLDAENLPIGNKIVVA